MFVEYTQPNIFIVNQEKSQVKLIPGINNIDEKDWQVIKDHPGVQYRLNNGIIKVKNLINNIDGNGNSNDSLASYDPKTAKELIKNTFSKELLEKWFSQEERAPLRKLLEQQLEILKIQKKEQKVS